jgi:hypothetical protein
MFVLSHVAGSYHERNLACQSVGNRWVVHPNRGCHNVNHFDRIWQQGAFATLGHTSQGTYFLFLSRLRVTMVLIQL